MDPTTKPAAKHKGGAGSKITKYLPRATTFTVPSRPYSPGRTTGAAATEAGASRAPNSGYPHHHHRSSFSGPISIIPPEARQRKPTTDPVEPTSPKVSCIGQVKRHKDAACRAAKAAADEKKAAAATKKRTAALAAKQAEDQASSSSSSSKNKPPKFVLMRFLRSKSGKSQAKGREVEDSIATGSAAAAPAPPLGQLRRFSSGRTALAGFDWRSANAAICPLETPVGADSPVTKGRGEEESDDDDGYYGLHKDHDDDCCKIPHSAPMVLGGGEGGGTATQPTRNQQQVNLWKRRTMAPPKPLQLN